MNRSKPNTFKTWTPSGTEISSTDLIGEEPLLIKIEESPWAVILRTPGEEKEHAAGLCMAEGVISSRGDITGIDVSPLKNTVTVHIKKELHSTISKVMKRQGFMSRSGENPTCEKALENLKGHLNPSGKNIYIPPEKAHAFLETLSHKQPLRLKTRAAHAAAIYDNNLNLMALSEDVGRHNALDKSVGKILLEGDMDSASVLVLSSRISYELVQKAARADIPMILSMSRPTAFAVELAANLNITTACLSKNAGIHIFSGDHRFEPYY